MYLCKVYLVGWLVVFFIQLEYTTIIYNEINNRHQQPSGP